MDWRVEFHDDAWGADLARATDVERQSVRDEVASWVPDGPPDDPIKKYTHFEVFEHEVAGFVVVYQILESEDAVSACVEVKRIRRKLPDWL